ncbi:Sensory/regulatory protein RpfC [Caulifigura coniformis]|uniref:histidine kinase n=1 Tax=Caulifigura coniformis TaxID=2527983 RepID=A0A517S7U1_9PLAN|nr:response regulator [Caulifigura coniformis]QDT52197.1 Sensory/regulatory protein RpfC [Caulifigura coniformis]
MSETPIWLNDDAVRRRAQEIDNASRRKVYQRTDRMFVALLLLQWLAAIIAAAVITPATWQGTLSSVHPHLWLAVFLGGALCSLPIFFAWKFPGDAITRQTIAVAQVLFSSLLIHITGGRIETHFHIFGSLAFIAAYRDWKLLIAPTIVTASDHLIRGLFWPETIFGAASPGHFRWLEHAAWVLFEDIFLVISIRRGVADQREMAIQTARRELHQEHLEDLIDLRTSELAAATASAEGANRAKSAFLANMSHEIRTPMTSIMGFADTLLEWDQSPEERREALQTIRRSARHLLDLINDILDISRIEAGRMTIEQIPVDVSQIAADVASLMRPVAIAKKIDLQLTFGEQVPKTVLTDPLRVKQLLVNLVSNAVKFTDHGHVRVHVSSETRDGNCFVNCAVTDTGVGLTPQQLDRLFQPFTQADESMTRRYGGTGLGLAISKRLVELLGGELTVESLPTVGSVFRFSVNGGPVTELEMVQQLNESSLSTTDRADYLIRLRGRILLAEDGLDNQKLLSQILRKAGAEVVVAENGRAAIEAIIHEEFHLVVMDMQMPEMDGYTATRQLRSMGFHLPVIALTAHAMSGDRQKCLDAGCSDYLTKPIARSALLSAVARLMPEGIESVPSAAAQDSIAKIRSEFADDPDMAELVAQFVEVLPSRMASLTEQLRRDDLPALQRSLHQLKGAGGGYGFQEITTCAAGAELAIKNQDPLPSIHSEIQSLLTLVRSVEGYETARELCHES